MTNVECSRISWKESINACDELGQPWIINFIFRGHFIVQISEIFFIFRMYLQGFVSWLACKCWQILDPQLMKLCDCAIYSIFLLLLHLRSDISCLHTKIFFTKTSHAQIQQTLSGLLHKVILTLSIFFDRAPVCYKDSQFQGSKIRGCNPTTISYQ